VDDSGHPADDEADSDTDPAPRNPSTSDPHPPRNREQARREGFER
jgi:hypothetical protein